MLKVSEDIHGIGCPERDANPEFAEISLENHDK
jgi:hypothetical protein